MSKNFILLTAFLFSSAPLYAVCTAPADFKCECQHPIIEGGKLTCGPSYCADKKCMPDGSCCAEANYCQSTEKGKQCCEDGQTCDTRKGCIEAKVDIETLCANAGGKIIIATNDKKFCKSKNFMDWNDSKKWCEDNGMIMPEMHEMCPAWLEIGSDYMQGDICPELSSVITNVVWSATEYGYGTEKDSAFALHPTTGYVIYNGKGLYFEDDGNLAFCH